MAGQLTDITHANGGTVLARSAYTLDVLGRRTSQTREDGITETYGYDATSQLTSADYGVTSPLAKAAAPVTRETFAYDALGNRTQVGRVVPNAPSGTTSYTANALNQYTQVGGVAFAYDANGNLTNDGKQTYRYDAQNRLLAVEPVAPATGAVRAEFAYDARNRAVARTYYTLGKAGGWALNSDDSRALTYDTSWNLLAECTRNGAQVGEYIQGQRTDEILRAELKPANSPITTYYPLPDGLGSVVALAGDSGRIFERFRYSAYGQPTSLSATYQASASSVFGYRLLFTGREWLSAIGLNEHRNRYYSVSSGRWLNSDLIGFLGGKNFYRYATNSPAGKNEPLGLDPNQCGDTDVSKIKSIVTQASGMEQLAANTGNSDRYFYTEVYGWVDVRHFATAAIRVRDGSDAATTAILGFGLEVYQWLTEWGSDYRSGFSAEDLPSNDAGISFGYFLRAAQPGTSIQDTFALWSDYHAKGHAKDDGVTNYGALPRFDPALPANGCKNAQSNASSAPCN
jgi:RHS repeat-associated protein